jgi:holo-[acyl-carrier protein] synthase
MASQSHASCGSVIGLLCHHSLSDEWDSQRESEVGCLVGFLGLGSRGWQVAGAEAISGSVPRFGAKNPDGLAMLTGIGTDIHAVARMQRELDKPESGVRDSVFNASEIARCNGARHPARAFAGCFALKEALFKALGTGWSSGLSWLDIEVDTTSPKVTVLLSGAAARAANKLGATKIHASVSQTSRLAIATVLLEA